MDRRKKKQITRMGYRMDYLLIGMRMDRSLQKELTLMEKKTGSGLNGMKMEIRRMK